MIDALFNLNRASSSKGKMNKAPHKPILLLSIIHEIEEGRIPENKVFITPELLATFKETWSRLVEGNWQCKFFLPFYHMQNDKPKFWFLQTEPGASVVLTSSYSPKSVSGLIDAVKYACFADWLWEILSDPARREEMRMELLKFYFPNKMLSPADIHRTTETYLRQLELKFNTSQAADKLPPSYRLIEREARCALFKSRIPEIYNHTCAISGQRIISLDDSQMIDACHIKPWRRTKDDSIQNGIALTPTIHRAFDRGIVKIRPDYTVSISDTITESTDSPFNLMQFEGKKILLPERREWWPRVR